MVAGEQKSAGGDDVSAHEVACMRTLRSDKITAGEKRVGCLLVDELVLTPSGGGGKDTREKTGHLFPVMYKIAVSPEI